MTVVEAGTETSERIIAAALAVTSDFGIRGMSMSTVAQHAGVSRPTLYKYFPSKDQLIAALVAAEATVIADQIESAARQIADPRQALEVAIATALTVASEHALLQRIIRTEPEAITPYLFTAGSPSRRPSSLDLLTDRMMSVIIERFDPEDLNDAASGDPAAVAIRVDALTRLLVSYAINTPSQPVELVSKTLATLFFPSATQTPPQGAT